MKLKPVWGVVLALGLGVSVHYLWALAQGTSAWGGWAPMSGASWWGIALAVGLQWVAHGLRAHNSQRLLSAIRPAGLLTSVRGLSIGFLFNVLLPFRLGELVRAHVVGKAMSISRAVVFFTILFERAVDGILLSLFALGAWSLLKVERPEVAGLVAGLGAGVLLVSVAVATLIFLLYSQHPRLLRWVRGATGIFNDRIRDRLRFVLWSITYGLHVIFRSTRLVRYVAVSALMWTLYLLSVVALLQDVAPASGFLRKLSTAAGAYLSVSIPSGPAFIGTFHYYFSLLAQGALGIAVAPLALSVVTWAVLMAPFALLGLGFLGFARRSEPQVLQDLLEPLKYKLHRDLDISSELSHFLDEYFSGQQLSHVLSRSEMAGDYRIVKTFKGGSNASTLLVWEEGKLQVKKLTLLQHADKLKAQHDWLGQYAHLSRVPRVTRELYGKNFYSFNLEYRESFVPFFDYLHSESLENSYRVLEGVLDFVYGHIYETGQARRSAAELERYLDEKVLGKVQDAARMSPVLAALVAQERLIINGRDCLNLPACVRKLRSLPRALEDLETFHHTPIHGDLTVDNIIVCRRTGEFLVLDPNNENAISDPVVDLGKLYQSLHSGYEFLCGLSSARVDGAEIRFEESKSSRYSAVFEHLQKLVHQRVPEGTRRAILFHEAVHYCRMLTYRVRLDPATVAAFYGIAVRLFGEFLNQYEAESPMPEHPAHQGAQTYESIASAEGARRHPRV